MNQPDGDSFEYVNEWSSGLCDCLSDCKTLLCACFCQPCYAYLLNDKAGECGCTAFFCPAWPIGVRTKVRAQYRIQGAFWKDMLLLYFCGLCTLLQVGRELEAHGHPIL